MKKIKRLTSAVMAVIMVCTSVSAFTLGAAAEEMPIHTPMAFVTLTGNQSLVLSAADGKKYYEINGEKKWYTSSITIKTSGVNDKGITVESGTHDIVFEDVKFNDSVVIKKNATANITLKGKNEITAKVGGWFMNRTGKAGINVPEGATLNLSGNGYLDVNGSDDGSEDGGAGIGGNNIEDAGTINICANVTVNAEGGCYAAGIGGGDDGDGGNITISGGIVNAKGGHDAAGIGGGSGASLIGGDGENITITGGTVTATGGKNGAGIGGGYDGDGGNVNISGGTVIATGGENGAGIGGGFKGNGGDINISEGKVKATGGKHGAGIGGGCGCGTTDGECGNLIIDGECGNVIIKDAEIEAVAGEKSEPIGGGCDEFGSGKITVNGKEVSKDQRKELKNNKTCYIHENKITKENPFITSEEKKTEEKKTEEKKAEVKPDTTPVKEKEYAKLNLKNSVISEDNGLVYSDITKQYLTSTQFIDVKDLKISIGEGYSYRFAEYRDKNKSAYLGSSEWMSGDFSSDKLSKECKYVRIAVRNKNSDEKITTKDKTGFTVNGKAFTLNNGAMLSDGLVYSNTVNSSRLSDTQYFEISNISEIEVGNNYQYEIAYYNDGKDGKKQFEKMTDWTSEKTTVDTTYRYCRVTVKKADGSTLNSTENTGLKVCKK